MHAKRIHGDKGPSRSLKGSDGFPCLRAKDFNCDKTITSSRNAIRHDKEAHDGEKWSCPLAEEEGCTWEYTDPGNAKRHANHAHGDDVKPTQKDIPYPRVKEEKCPNIFIDRGNTKTHAIMAHGKFEPDVTFIPAWPRISRDIPLRDVDGKTIPGWEKLP